MPKAKTLLAGIAVTAGALLLPAPHGAGQDTFLGAVGCSQTEGAMIGNQEAGYTQSWDMSGSGYGGGAIHEWTPGRPQYWDRFQSLLNQYPQTTDIYWMLCVREAATSTPTQADFDVVEAIAAEIAGRAPSVTIWASAMNDFDGVVCPISGTTGPAISRTLADFVAGLGLAERGPDISPLTQATVSPDNCHPNEAGRLLWGEELHTVFFEGGTIGGGGGFDGMFSDDDGNVHEPNIEIIAAQAITQGCGGTLYCPADLVTRGQMASFLARMLGLTPGAADHFTDDNGTTHEPNINAIADAGITLGTGNGHYDPDGYVTRDQMASFLVRALDLAAVTADYFTDDNGTTHEPNINIIRANNITLGCDPTATLYCPHDPVRRDQMASFLARSLAFVP